MKIFFLFVLTACLNIAFSLLTAGKAFSQAGQETTTGTTADGTSYVTGITPGRAKSLVGVVLGLASVGIGWRAKARSAVSLSNGRKWAIAALVAGPLAIVLAIIHLATLTGGFGTGGGKAGAIVALALGFIGTVLGGLTLLRSNKIK